MQSRRQSFTVCSLPAVVESLEKRGYLSASALLTCPDASAAAPVQASIAAPLTHATTRKISPSKVVTPVDLTPQIDGIVKRSVNAKTITIQVIVKNAGPAKAKGTLRITVQFSYYLNGAYPFPFRAVNTPINISAGGSKSVRITATIPKSYRPFEYDMVVTLNGNKKIPETNYANDVANSAYYYLA
jgi:hypothetical protein